MTQATDRNALEPDPTLGIVSIDFGSTASTAATFAQLRGAVAAMDAEHVQLVRKHLVELISSPWPTAELRDEFGKEARERVAATFPRLRREPRTNESDLDQLLRWILQEAPERDAYEHFTEPLNTGVLDQVWVMLAEFVELHEPLQQWGHLKLHEILHQALRTPAFVQNNLVRIELEGKRTQINSVLMVKGNDVGRAELTDLPPDPASGRLYFRDLKRRTLKPVPLPLSLQTPGREDSDVLVGQVYRDLKKRIMKFAIDELKATGHRLSHVIITYPTTTPPAVRQRLRELIRQELGVDQVTMRFDEGVAALMFVLMRDFGGDDEAGIETFRARSRMAEDGHWRQNLLVIDIGGGTTDIALTRLELDDATKAVDRIAERREESGPDAAAEGQPRTRGRVYFLHPQVLGSTGHQQYGGDLLTLRVFYWIKALIADAIREMVADQPEAEQLLDGWPSGLDERLLPLAQAVTDYQEPGPAPGHVARYLRAVLPTASNGGADGEETYGVQLEPAFELLWGIAETAKRTLAAGKPYQLLGTELSKIAGQLGGAWQAKIAALPANGLPLKVEDFDRLARSVLNPAIELAVDLTQRCLRDDPGELLDGIALTGRAAGMPLVRELVLDRLAEAFGTRDRVGGPMAWNPALVTTEHDHPKEAASIGACWAQAKYQDAQKNLVGLADGLHYKSGRDQLLIKVNNLVINLPCRFGLGTAGRTPLDLLGHGHPLDGCDWTGRRFARTRWHPATPDIRLLRFLDQQRYILWGHYDIENRLGFSFPDDLYFQIQIDDELVPTLYLCRGRIPHYGLEGSMIDLTGRLPADCFGRDRSLRSLPWDICVRVTGEADGDETYRTVIRAMPTVTETSFRQSFVPVIQAQRNPAPGLVRAVISAELPPPQDIEWVADETAASSTAPGAREYTFAGIAPGQAEPQWTESIPATQRQDPRARTGPTLPAASPDVPHWTVLDSSGRLYLPEPGYPRYQPATDLRMMLNMPGSVFSTPMEPPQPDLRRDWDPFSGEH